MKRNGLFALIALALSGIGAAQAQDYSNWYIAPRVGAVIPDGDRETETSLFTGLGFGFWTNPNFAVDFEVTHNNADFENDSIRNGHEFENVGVGVAGRYFFGDAGSSWRPASSIRSACSRCVRCSSVWSTSSACARSRRPACSSPRPTS